MHEKAYQITLDDKQPQTIYSFNPETYIELITGYYPGAYLVTSVTADRSDQRKRGFNHIFTSREGFTIRYRGNRYCSFPIGTKFVTWSKFAHQIELS